MFAPGPTLRTWEPEVHSRSGEKEPENVTFVGIRVQSEVILWHISLAYMMNFIECTIYVSETSDPGSNLRTGSWHVRSGTKLMQPLELMLFISIFKLVSSKTCAERQMDNPFLSHYHLKRQTNWKECFMTVAKKRDTHFNSPWKHSRVCKYSSETICRLRFWEAVLYISHMKESGKFMQSSSFVGWQAYHQTVSFSFILPKQPTVPSQLIFFFTFFFRQNPGFT